MGMVGDLESSGGGVASAESVQIDPLAKSLSGGIRSGERGARDDAMNARPIAGGNQEIGGRRHPVTMAVLSVP